MFGPPRTHWGGHVLWRFTTLLPYNLAAVIQCVSAVGLRMDPAYRSTRFQQFKGTGRSEGLTAGGRRFAIWRIFYR
jgi:hypothetical protein